MKLSGKVALVTGGGRGIGRAIALTFAEEGADIIVNTRSTASAQETVSRVEQLGRRAIAACGDIASEKAVDNVVQTALDAFGKIDILVNNAGINDVLLPTVEKPMEDWDRVHAIHLRGTYMCSRRVGQWMTTHGGGKILNISSISAFRGFPLRTAYGPAKAAIINLTQCLAVEWGKYNINVNCVAPGYVHTDIIKERVAAGVFDVEVLKGKSPLGRLAEPEDIAKAVLFLVSDDAKCITGTTLIVDGGWHANQFP